MHKLNIIQKYSHRSESITNFSFQSWGRLYCLPVISYQTKIINSHLLLLYSSFFLFIFYFLYFIFIFCFYCIYSSISEVSCPPNTQRKREAEEEKSVFFWILIANPVSSSLMFSVFFFLFHIYIYMNIYSLFWSFFNIMKILFNYDM